MQNTAPYGRTSDDHFELVVRLQQPRTNPASENAVRLRSQGLVKDILMSRLEVDAEVNAHEYVHIAGFTEPGKALAASRALQVAFEGFRAAVPAGRAYISVVLDSSSPAAAHPGPSVEQKDLLSSAKPSQVLLTQAFYDRIANYQPSLRSSPLSAGVYEFLWTSEQRLDTLQSEAEFTPSLVPEPAAATLVSGSLVSQPALPPNLMDTIISPRTRTYSEPEPRTQQPDRRPALDPQPASAEDAADEVHPWLSTWRVAAAGGVAAILFVVGYLVHSAGLLSNQTKPPVQMTKQAQQSPAALAPAPPPAAPPSAPTQAVAPGNVGPAKITPAVPVKPARSGAATSSQALASPPPMTKPSKVRGCSIDGEVPSYLNLAENNRSNGKYDRAISEYTLVLGCEPWNRQALDGLQKAKTADALRR